LHLTGLDVTTPIEDSSSLFLSLQESAETEPELASSSEVSEAKKALDAVDASS